MDNKDFREVLSTQLQKKYFTPNNLMYSSDAGTYLSPYDYQKYLDFVDEKIKIKEVSSYIFPLKSFNTKHIYFIYSAELLALIDVYKNMISETSNRYESIISSKFNDEINQSRIYSEIEGSLNVENVPTTRKRLIELIDKKEEPKNINDNIILNMAEGIKYIKTLPEFNKKNLFKLYQILSNKCLKEEDKIKENLYYRDDEVEVDNYQGCPSEEIEEYMDSLFDYVNKIINSGNYLEKLLLPHISHYYIVYIHPYFDYNGRTARMVSLWINLLLNQNDIFPPVISEAINQTKKDYYNSLRDTRNARNDLSYFLLYIFNITIQYILCYKDLDNIDQILKNDGEVLSKTELNYIKRILITYKGKFTYKSFISNCQIDITKQGAFKILNKFVKLKILNVEKSQSKVKLFDINKKVIKYTKM